MFEDIEICGHSLFRYSICHLDEEEEREGNKKRNKMK